MTPKQITAKKLQLLRQIEAARRRAKAPTFRACGLSEEQAKALWSEELIEVLQTSEDGSFIDDHRVNKITDVGLAILAAGDTAPDPISVRLDVPQKPIGIRVAAFLWNRIWDLLKVAFGVVLGWWLKSRLG